MLHNIYFSTWRNLSFSHHVFGDVPELARVFVTNIVTVVTYIFTVVTYIVTVIVFVTNIAFCGSCIRYWHVACFLFLVLLQMSHMYLSAWNALSCVCVVSFHVSAGYRVWVWVRLYSYINIMLRHDTVMGATGTYSQYRFMYRSQVLTIGLSIEKYALIIVSIGLNYQYANTPPKPVSINVSTIHRSWFVLLMIHNCISTVDDCIFSWRFLHF